MKTYTDYTSLNRSLVKLLQEQQPTLEGLTEEWEEDGFKFERIFCYQLINRGEDIQIYFDNDERGLWCHIIGHLNSKQLIRLILTFLALGWEVL